MNVLSLFDGISSGYLALQRAGIKIDNYYASEVDKYAIQISRNNFPNIIHLDKIENICVTNFQKIDLLIGGVPLYRFIFCGKTRGV